MLFSYLSSGDYPHLIFDDVNIKFVPHHKHLGLTLSENMKWKNHIDSILTSASRMIGIMRKLKIVFSRRALNQIYITHARLILEYSSMVWDGWTIEQRNSLEKLQNEAAIVSHWIHKISLLFVALWFNLRGDLLYFFPCVILFLCFSVLLVLRLPRLGKRELILVLFVRLFDLCLFGFVGFLFLSGSGKGCGLWLWHSLDFSLTCFSLNRYILNADGKHFKSDVQTKNWN